VPVELLVRPAKGGADVRTTRPKSGGAYRLPLPPTIADVEQVDLFAITASGLVRVVQAKTNVALGAVNYVETAQQRINALKGAPSPWENSASAQHGGAVVTAVDTGAGAHEIAVSLEDQPSVVVSPDAEAAALAVFRYFGLQPPPSTVAIFPREDGGLRLQTVGNERAVIVDISVTGDEFAGEYAGDDVYHTQIMRNAHDAALFIAHSSR
jgi:hypothetical protein